MNWTSLLLVAVVVAVLLAMKRAGQISAKDARAHLKNGALVIDVRSSGEFISGHLSAAINIPLDEIETAMPRRVTDKNQVLLLHCQSGVRSALAMRKLRKADYVRVFNLGSYGRAESILERQQ